MSTERLQASRVRRLVAAMIDLLITATVAFIALWPLGLFESHEAYAPPQLFLRAFVLLSASYFIVNGWLLYKSAQTLGKRLLGLKMVHYSDGRNLRLGLLLIRGFSVLILTILSVVSLPALGLIVLIDTLLIFSPSRRCLHDYLVGSRVCKSTTRLLDSKV